MTNARNSGVILLSAIALLLSLPACQNRSFQPVTMFDDPSRFVRLEADRGVGGGHSHPADITTDDMIAILSGVMIEEPLGFIKSLSFRTKDDEMSRHPAFNEAEIRFFAPYFAEGLKTATSDQIVTFGQTSQNAAFIDTVASAGMLVTSGGLFINGDGLHFILGNYRSPTNYAPDPGIGATLDGRSAPLQSIAPQRTKLSFEPATAVAPLREGIVSRMFRPHRQEIVVLFKQLGAGTAETGQ